MPHLAPFQWFILPVLFSASLLAILSLSWWTLPPSWPSSPMSVSSFSTPLWSWHN